MIHTAIIAFILIGTMFLFTECGNKENAQEATKLEQQRLADAKHQAEIKAKEEVEAIAKERARAAAESERVKRGRLEARAKAKAELLEKAKLEAKEKAELEAQEELIADEVLNSEHSEDEVVHQVTLKNDTDEVNVSIPTVPTIVYITEEEALNATTPNTQKNTVTVLEQEIIIPAVPRVKLNVDKNEVSIEENSTVNLQLTRELEREKNKEKSLKQQLERVRLLAENGEKKAREYENNKNKEIEALLEEKRELEDKLSSVLEDKKQIGTKNIDLEEKILKLLSIAKEGTHKAETEFASLLSVKESLETNLTKEKKNEELLKIENTNLANEKNVLKNKIVELLNIAKKGTEKAEKEFDSLLLTKASLEANLTEHIEQEKAFELESAKLASETSELKSKINKLLMIAKDGTEKAEVEFNSLLSAKASLENNLTGHLEYEKTLEDEKIELANEKSELKNKIIQLLDIAKKGTQKAEVEFNSLLSAKASLEANLTEHIEHEKALEDEKVKLVSEKSELKNKIDELLALEKEDKQKENKEFTALLSVKKSLEANLTEHIEHEKALEDEKMKLVSEESTLKNKITQLLNIGKQDAAKAQLALSSIASHEKALETENEKLKATLEEMKKEKSQLEAEKAAAEAKAKEEAEKAAAEAKAKEEAEKAAAVAKAKEEAEKAAAEAKAKEEAEKAAAEAKAKEEAEKAAAVAKAKEEAEKAAAEAKAKEEAEKAAAEAKAKEEAEKAAAEAKAKEEAEKAAAEAKAKEEAEKAAAEAKAKEEAEKIAAKAKEAESKLMNAFSLTKVEFKTASMQLTYASKKRLDIAVETMKNYEGYSYIIQGHTDSRGNEDSNLKLSTRRAEAVKNYLVSKGIDANILSVEGFGSAHPIASNDTKKGREENRRVVFQIVK